jgi:putative hemolysin
LFVEFLVILALVLLNGVFSGAEIAVLSLRKTRLAELVEAGSHSARAVSRLRQNPESFLATVQIGITVIGATAAAFGGASVAAELTPLFARVPALAPFAENLAVAVVVAGVSFLSLVLGELVPKSLALRAGEPYALLIARPLSGLAWAGRPVIAVLTGASNLVLRLFGDHTNFVEARLSREEVQQIVEEAATAGSVDEHAGEIASRALDFSSLDAYTVMVPRSEMVTLPKDADPREVARVARAAGHARVPVYDGAPDNFVGFVNLRDVLAEAVLGPGPTSDALLHPVVFVPDTMPAPALLRKLQLERRQIALVTDEQGTVIGLATIEDLVEELVGEIFSENDAPRTSIAREANGSWLVSGNAPLHEVNRELSLNLPEGGFATLAGLCLHLAGAIPAVGWVGHADGVVLEVVEATPRRVRRVRVRRTG